MESSRSWQADLYDNKLRFVSQFGKDVVDLLSPKSGERILDLGCGTGDLSAVIAQSQANVIGIDQSHQMIEKARAKFPEIEFYIDNAEYFSLDEQVDAVFSNAALHWMKNPEQVIASVRDALKDGGRFVAEFGGKGNLQGIVDAITEVLSSDYGLDASERNPWFFPGIGEYSTLLEQQGFRVTYAVHFDRPTILEDGDHGLTHWLKVLAAEDFFKGFDDSERSDLYKRVAAVARPALYNEETGTWVIDYKRLRIVAIKE